MHNLNIPIKGTELETFPQNFRPRWFHQTFKEEIISIPLTLFQKTEEVQTLPNSFPEARIILIPKPDKNITRKEN